MYKAMIEGVKLLENKYIDLAIFYKAMITSEQAAIAKLFRKTVTIDKSIEQAFDQKKYIRQQETAIRENALIKNLMEVKN